MNKKFKVFIAFILTFVMFCNVNIFAASVNISANTSVEIGNNVTITISVPGVTGKCTVTSSNSGVVELSTSSIWVESGVTSPIVGYTKAAGSATITVTPDTMADDITGDDVVVAAKSVTINVKEKYVPPPPVVEENTNQDTNQNTGSNNNETNNGSTNTGTNTGAGNGNTTNNNNTNTNTGTNTGTNNNVSNNNSNNNNNTATKSSNAFLGKLQVNVEGLTPNFNKNKYSYTLAIEPNINSINVTATPEDSKAKVNVWGNTELKEGDNTISIVVTAQNGAQKTYTIIATKSADPMKSDSYLANLIIEDLSLTPEFSSEVFEYELGKTSLDKLNIYTYPKNEKAKVEITGNDSLVEGENIVKIKVTSEDETTTKEYILKVIKEVVFVEEENENVEVNALVDSTNLNKTSKLQKLKSVLLDNWLVVLLFVFVVVEFIEILYLYSKYHNIKVTVPWKDYDEDDKNNNNNEKEEKTSWFKKLNKNNDDFTEIEKNEDVSEDKFNNKNKIDIKNKVEENEITNEVEDEVQENTSSYEEILSQINEIGDRIDKEINSESKDLESENESEEPRTRNGRK